MSRANAFLARIETKATKQSPVQWEIASRPRSRYALRNERSGLLDQRSLAMTGYLFLHQRTSPNTDQDEYAAKYKCKRDLFTRKQTPCGGRDDGK